MKFLFILSTVIFAALSPASAGNERGGGHVYLCQDGSIRFADNATLAISKRLNGLNEGQALNKVLSVLRNVDPEATKSLDTIISNFVLVKDSKLVMTENLLPKIPSCSLEQLAVQDMSLELKTTIHFNDEYFQRLPPADRALFKIHEASLKLAYIRSHQPKNYGKKAAEAIRIGSLSEFGWYNSAFQCKGTPIGQDGNVTVRFGFDPLNRMPNVPNPLVYEPGNFEYEMAKKTKSLTVTFNQGRKREWLGFNARAHFSPEYRMYEFLGGPGGLWTPSILSHFSFARISDTAESPSPECNQEGLTPPLPEGSCPPVEPPNTPKYMIHVWEQYSEQALQQDEEKPDRFGFEISNGRNERLFGLTFKRRDCSFEKR